MNESILRAVLSMSLLLAFCAAACALFLWELPAANRDLSCVLLGVLAASLKDIVGYHYGASSGGA